MTVAVLGTGIMGAAMARNWSAAGERVRAWNRSADRAAPLTAAGVTVVEKPEQAVVGADVVVTMLYDADSVAEVITAAAPGLRAGALWLQMSTVGPDGARRLAELAAEVGLTYVDAPVVGTRQPAEEGKLVVLASGPQQERERVERFLAPVAARVRWLGEAGAGSRLKLVVNSWVLTSVAGLAQALALADGLGVEPAQLLEVISGGAVDMPYAHLKARVMLAGEYPAAFPVSGALKDATLIAEAAAGAGVDARVIDAARQLLAAASDAGHRDADMAAVFEVTRPWR